VSAALAGVITTGALGALGIAGTFFAPILTQTRIARRQERREFRRARRLIAAELQMAFNQLGVTRERINAGEGLPEEFPFADAEWQAHRDALAAGLPDDAWAEVSRAYAVLWGVRSAAHRHGTLDLSSIKGASDALQLAQRMVNDARPLED
jgi:hypothetical protein